MRVESRSSDLNLLVPTAADGFRAVHLEAGGALQALEMPRHLTDGVPTGGAGRPTYG